MTQKVLILSDDRESERELAALVRAAGGWVTDVAGPGAVPISAYGNVDLVVADLRGLSDFAAFHGVDANMVVEVGREAIDAAAAAFGMAQLLVDPDPIERAAAIAVALAQGDDAVREGASPGLRQLSEDAGRIARALADLATAGSEVSHPPAAIATAAPAMTAASVRALIRKRRLRDRFFAPAIFADPAWDMLLDLYAARLEGAQVAVSSLCIAAHVPPTTALRWIAALTEQGLFARVADPADRRRIFIALTEGAAGRMAAYLAAAEGGSTS